PPGTVVPPAGFVLIRGINASPVPAELLVENGGNTIELVVTGSGVCVGGGTRLWFPNAGGWFADRKSTRLNSSHVKISYAVFCLKCYRPPRSTLFPYTTLFRSPPGTVVPPAGFVLIRGINASPVPAELLVENGGNTIELVVTGSGVCVGGGTRLWFPNAGGWF